MNPDLQKRYDVFISYARKDYMDEKENIIPGNIISRIKEIFDQEKVSYWFDTGEIIASNAYAEKITEAIIRSDAFLFISSEKSNASQWTSKEISLAHHFNKKLVPFRIDTSFYNPRVAFYIADIDYIDYYVNPERAIERLKKSIVEPVKKREEEKRKEEEEKKREEDRRKKEKEQQQKDLINEIKLDTGDLDANERKVINDREKLLFKVSKVDNEDNRKHLVEEIDNTVLARERKEVRQAITALQQNNQELEGLIKEKSRDNHDLAGQFKTLCERHEALTKQHEEQIDVLTQKIKVLSEELEKYKEPQKKRRRPICKNEGNNFSFLKINNQHSLATKILLILSMLVLVVSSIWCLSFADDWLNGLAGWVKTDYSINWAIAELVFGFISAFLLFEAFINNRVSAVTYIVPMAVIAVSSFFESSLPVETNRIWPTMIESMNIFIPFGVIILVAYITGLCSLFIKNRNTLSASWAQMTRVHEWEYFNPTRHFGLYVTTLAIIAVLMINM